MIEFRPTGKEINGQLEIELLEDPFKGVTFYYGSMKFADQENEDGSMNMSFDYEVTCDAGPKNNREFEKVIGDLLLQIIETQMKNNEVVYRGGTNENVIESDID